MKIEVHFWNQLREASGVDQKLYDLKSPATLKDLLHRVAQTRVTEASELTKLIFADDDRLSPGILIDRNSELLRDPDTPLADGDQIHLATPISGG